jgi:BASS family bile acid:Na+ symporter
MTVATVSIALALLFAALAIGSRRVKTLHGLGFTFAVLAVGCAAVAHPPLFIVWSGFELKQAISPLVQVILLGMGMTLTLDDFRRVFTMPRGVVLCCVLHYTIMPLGGFFFAHLFGLQGAVATGLILIGSVPSGTSSNVISLLARVNVPLSVTVTAVSTLISPFITPIAMKWLAGTEVTVEAVPMMISILKMIIAPLLIGLVVQRYLHTVAKSLARVLPFIAMLAICTIIGVTIALSREQLFKVGLTLFAAAACHNATGYLLGYWGGRLAGLNKIDARTTALEVGLQNGGMATGLAFGVLNSPLAALASAVFGPWSVVTSSMLASWWRKNPTNDEHTQPSSS